MSLQSCIVTLLVVYPLFLVAGIWFYRHMQKTKPHPIPEKDPRSKFVRSWRFMVYILLLPLATTLSLAVLGVLDPLFYLIRDIRR